MSLQRLVALAMLFLLPCVVSGAEYARSDSFVVIAPDHELADEALARAEDYRRRIALEWLGEEIPAGVGQAMIHLLASRREERAVTWALTGKSSRQYHRVWIIGPRGLRQ